MEEMIVYAKQQITGYIMGAEGYGITDLVISMGLEATEWEEIKKEEWIASKYKDEIDEYFKN